MFAFISQKVESVIMRSLRDSFFYKKTNALQDFHICISVHLRRKIFEWIYFRESFILTFRVDLISRIAYRWIFREDLISPIWQKFAKIAKICLVNNFSP